MGSAVQRLEALYQECIAKSTLGFRQPNHQEIETFRNRGAEDLQVELFLAGYDENPFHSDAEKALARGEYVARWYQIYHGGWENSLKFAKFLIENRSNVIDHFIQQGK